MKLATIFFLAMFLVSCSNKVEVKNNCYKNLEANETEIYSVIADFWLEKSNNNKFGGDTVFIFNKTHSLKDDHPNISLIYRSRHLNYETDLLEDFEQKNKESVLLNNLLKISNKYQYFSPETKFYKDNLVKDFINAYPNASFLIGFSRIGFNKDYTKAIAYSYNLFDRGSYFNLENQDCKWKIVNEIPLWHH